MKKRIDYIIIDRLCELAIEDFEKIESIVFWLDRYKSVFQHLERLENSSGVDNTLGNRFPMQMENFNNIYNTYLNLISKTNFSHTVDKEKFISSNSFQPDFLLN